MPIANYRTSVPASRSRAEIEKWLVEFGARGILTEWDADRRAIALSFAIEGPSGPEHYHLPARIEGVRAALVADRQPASVTTLQHAERVAWRCLRDWVRAQLAIIRAGLTTLDEVMLPYMRTISGHTVYEDRLRQLEASA